MYIKPFDKLYCIARLNVPTKNRYSADLFIALKFPAGSPFVTDQLIKYDTILLLLKLCW